MPVSISPKVERAMPRLRVPLWPAPRPSTHLPSARRSSEAIEAADTATFGELAQIMRAAGAAGYLRFEHSDPNGKRLHKTTTPGGGALAPVKKAEISAKALNAGIQPVVPAVLECYNTALGDDPTLSGTVEISITITPQGNVSGTEVKKGIESHLDRCVAEAVEETSFGAPGGTVVTSFPFNLAPR